MKKEETFKELHNPKKPIVLLNIWDKASAEILNKKGIDVIATSSYAVANNLGSEDGENISFNQLLSIAENLPGKYLSLDIESGYADSKDELQRNIERLILKNISGLNIEDKLPYSDQLQDKEQFINKIKWIREIDLENQLFINARTDAFFFGNIEEKNSNRAFLSDAVSLIQAYQTAGIDGIFIPGLKNKLFIKEIAQSIDIPVNIMLDIKKDNIEEYVDLGVSRISYGASLYLDWLSSGEILEDYLHRQTERHKTLQNKGCVCVMTEG